MEMTEQFTERFSKQFTNEIPAGARIFPWTIAGPVFVDKRDVLSERTFFENPVSGYGAEEAERIRGGLEAELGFLETAEGKETVVLGQKLRWHYLRSPERYYGFGEYFMQNHLGVILASTVLASPCEQKVRIRLKTRQMDELMVFLNHEKVFDNHQQLLETQAVSYELNLDLKKGDNHLVLGVFRIARGPEVGFCMELVQCEQEITASIQTEMESSKRALLERSVESAHLGRELFWTEEPIVLKLQNPEADYLQIEASLLDGKKQVTDSRKQTEPERIVFDGVYEPGMYQVKVRWFDPRS